MDTRTTEALDTLRADIGELRAELRGVEPSLTTRINGVELSLTTRINSVELSLTTRIDGVESALRADMASLHVEMRELHADARRHTDVLTESLRDDIRMVAEGVVALSAKIDTLRPSDFR